MMIKKVPLAAIFLFSSLALVAQEKQVLPGMKITRSTRIKKAIYRVDGGDTLDRPVIVVEGNDIVVDFSGAELRGSGGKKYPDEFFGVAVLVENSRQVTIKNLKAKGYKVALIAMNVQQLVLENCDFSYNYRPRLNSTQEKEDISDWMSYHHNENDEWLRYGAAIYLKDCQKAVVRDCLVTGGQNALMMSRCDNGRIYNNDFSFNSGIGMGMYRSSGNEVSFNKLNFNVRGYSHGVYNRGQDSAGILVYEQSHHNIFYKNSVTHSGDGFFLWAGQTTMDTGEGGCNDNLVAENDFSYAPTNGVEATFSRNRISDNRIYECDHGIWGGYSFNSKITGNKFRGNRVGIAIEHGLNNEISYNLFSRDREAIRLWARKEQPSDWGYARLRDTRSANYLIAMNSFNSNPTVMNISRTDSLSIFGNTYSNFETILKIDSTVTNIDSADGELPDTSLAYPRVDNPADPFKDGGRLAGRKNIMITEWGPYDFRYPLIWNSNPVDTGRFMNFGLFGPGGNWRIVSMKGLCCPVDSTTKKGFPGSIRLERLAGERTDIELVMEYTGTEFTDQFGQRQKGNKPYRFRFRKFFQPVDWEVDWFALDSSSNPIARPETLYQLNKLPPIGHAIVKKLDYAWWGGFKVADSTQKRFFTLAKGSMDIPEGLYELSVTWDDAVRVYLDDKLIIEEWNPSKYAFDESPNRKVRARLGGLHRLRVEHVELGGFACLSLKIRPVD